MMRFMLSAGPTSGAAENFFETAVDEFLRWRRRILGAQQTFRRHDDERLDEIAFHLAAQHMKILRRGREIADLDVVLGASLKEALEPRAGMFRALAFVAVRQQQHDPARPLPFRFRRDDELIDDGLRAVRKIAELRFPQAKHVWIIERVAVIESEHRGFGEQTVVNANARLFFGRDASAAHTVCRFSRRKEPSAAC